MTESGTSSCLRAGHRQRIRQALGLVHSSSPASPAARSTVASLPRCPPRDHPRWRPRRRPVVMSAAATTSPVRFHCPTRANRLDQASLCLFCWRRRPRWRPVVVSTTVIPSAAWVRSRQVVAGPPTCPATSRGAADPGAAVVGLNTPPCASAKLRHVKHAVTFRTRH